MYCNNLNTITMKFFHNHGGIYRFRKNSRKILERIVKDEGGNRQHVYHFVNLGLRIEIIFMKERTTENGGLVLK